MQTDRFSGNRILIIFIVFCLTSIRGTINARILQDTSSVKHLKQGI